MRSLSMYARGVLATAALAVPVIASAAPFTQGNLVLTRAVGGVADTSGGGGSVGAITTSTVLTGNGTAATVFLDEYTPAGVFVQSIQVPNVKGASVSGNYALTFSGTQNNEGAITLSKDGKYMTLVGYNQSAGAVGSNGVASGTIDVGGNLVAAADKHQRVVGVVNIATGQVNTTTALLDASSGISVRSAYTTNGTDLWVGGSNGANIQTTGVATFTTAGVRYTTTGSSTSTQLTVGAGNQRVLNGYNNQLYLSQNTTSATLRGISTVGTGIPTSGGPALPITQLPGFNAATIPTPASETADDYWFADANTLYIADQRKTDPTGTGGITPAVATEGGVQKWKFEDTNSDTIPDAWVFKYVAKLGLSTTLASGQANASTVGAHGLTGVVDLLGNVTLYATTFDGNGAFANKLVKLTDTLSNLNGVTFQASLTDLAISPTVGGFATAFRGVEIVPVVPEPASLSLLALGGLGLLARRRA